MSYVKIAEQHPCAWQHYSQWLKGGSNPSVHKWVMEKQNVVCSYSGILFSLREEVVPDACCSVDETWGQSRKDTPCLIPLIRDRRVVKLSETQREWRWVPGASAYWVSSSSLGRCENFSRWMGDDCTAIVMHFMPLNYTPKNGSSGSFGMYILPHTHIHMPFLVETPHKGGSQNSGFCLKQGHRWYSNCFQMLPCGPDSVLWPRGERLHIPLQFGANQPPDSSAFQPRKEEG